jgi:hypothetical protein
LVYWSARARPAFRARGIDGRHHLGGCTCDDIIVEDDDIVACDLQKALSTMGYSVPAVAAGGDEAIRLALERCPRLC